MNDGPYTCYKTEVFLIFIVLTIMINITQRFASIVVPVRNETAIIRTLNYLLYF